MSTERRPVPQTVLVCDLCREEIKPAEPSERGSVTHGYIAHDVTPRTKHAWLIWPPSRRAGPRPAQRTFDFHGECIVNLVAAAARDGEAT